MSVIPCIPLDTLKLHLGLESASVTAADVERLQIALRAATAQLEQIAGRRFVPRRATLNHAFDQPTELLLDDDLLELTSLTNGDGEAIDYADIELIGNGILHLRNGAMFNTGSAGEVKPIAVEGVWGWHDNWTEAWRLSGDMIDEVLSPAGTTTLPVQDADGSDPFGNTPRFRVGQLLRVSLEYISLLSINTVSNTMGVIRSVQGTTVIGHEVGSSIFVYVLPAQVESLIVRWAAWLYKAPENQAVLPAGLLAEVEALRRVRVKS
ncbi:MAG: hypothetical protein H7X77_10940 [Anaerolineae bacterium]|nr:hypothetical protein [Anaerolineae bacterium]